MPSRLHVTNGDLAAQRIGALVAPEPVLPWRDVLHEGPVPDSLPLEALSAERARFLAARFRLDPASTLARFRERDERLHDALRRGDGLVLWFEHDLYDQLQLVQILDLFGGEGGPAGQARLAQADTFLTGLAPAALARLGTRAPQVTPAQTDLARTAWAAFRAPTPEALARLHGSDTSALPWLGPALERLLAELPTGPSGLSATERCVLEELDHGPLPPGELFERCRARERAAFMGDASFFAVLDELAAEPSPLVAGPPPGGFPPEGHDAARAAYLAAAVRVTHAGRLAREGRLDRATARPLDRWLGGTHLTNDHVWRWEPTTATLRRG